MKEKDDLASGQAPQRNAFVVITDTCLLTFEDRHLGKSGVQYPVPKCCILLFDPHPRPAKALGCEGVHGLAQKYGQSPESASYLRRARRLGCSLPLASLRGVHGIVAGCSSAGCQLSGDGLRIRIF